MRESIFDEKRREIGWKTTVGTVIHYFTYEHGEIGQYDTVTKQYRRWKVRPGQTISPFPGVDYGMSDVLYWAEN